MILEVLYQLKFELTYGPLSCMTQTLKTDSVVWAGEASPIPLIEQKEREFLTADHAQNTQGQINHRIEITGLRIGGEHGLVFKPASGMTLLAIGMQAAA